VARARTRPLPAVLALLAVVLVAVTSTGQAQAAPSPTDLERQIDQAWQKLEPLVEQYNGVHEQLKANRAKQATLQARLQPLELQVDLALSRVGDVAAQAYRDGPAVNLNAILSGGSPTALADRMSMLDYLARRQHAQISGVEAMRDKYAAQKSTLDQLIATQARQDADLAARKKSIQAQMDKLQKLRQQAYGSSGALGNTRPVPCPVEYIPGPAGTAAKTACAQIGKPYVWAADGPGSFDCSGLTLYAWAAAGVTLRHYTKWQWADSTPVSRSELRPGDFVFYFSDLHHEAMYVGGGWVVHAPQTGDVVRMAKIDAISTPVGYRRPN
jgi:peptidoglycan DL-endopeptidase CwlO